MYKLCYLMALFITCNSIAQNSIYGKVVNEDNEPVAYCSIGIKNSTIGTISDENGNYTLRIPFKTKDDIVFSSIGYKDLIKSSDQLIENSTVILEYNAISLDPVVINAKKMKEKVIGQKSKPMLTFSKMFDQNIPTIEQGTIFNVYQKTKLKSYNFHIIPSSKFKEITLKLNIYNINDHIPDKVLLSENIIYKTNNTGWQLVDLTAYHLIFNNLKQIAVTLQLVDYKPLEGVDFVFGISAKKSISDDLLFRYQNQGKWEKSKGVFIANLDISYDKNTEEEEILDNQMQPSNDPQMQSLINYYTHKEKSLKTNYGKNKNGKYIDIGDAKIYYETYGKGEPLLLLHGNNGSISDFYQQIPALAKHFKVIAIDTRGQGRSTDFTTSDYSYELFANDLHKVIQQLDLKNVNILGWSDGGNTGLMFSLKHPELVNKLITIGANIHPEGVKDDLIKIFQRSTI